MRAKTAITVPLFAAIASGISYHPSIVNKRKIEYTLSAGFPKYWGADSLKRNVVTILNTNNSTASPIVTMNEALNANLAPLRRLSILGMNFSKRKDLNVRIILKDSRILVPGKSNPKRLMQEGRANRTRIKSNRLHPSDQ